MAIRTVECSKCHEGYVISRDTQKWQCTTCGAQNDSSTRHATAPEHLAANATVSIKVQTEEGVREATPAEVADLERAQRMVLPGGFGYERCPGLSGTCVLPVGHFSPRCIPPVETPAPPAHDPLRFRYNPSTETFDPPTPAAMLGEALELMTKAQVLALAAFDAMPGTMLSKENGLVRIGDARQWVTSLKREAEAREGRG